MTLDDHRTEVHLTSDQQFDLIVSCAAITRKWLRLPKDREEDLHGSVFIVLHDRIGEFLGEIGKPYSELDGFERTRLQVRVCSAAKHEYMKFNCCGKTSRFKKKKSKFRTNLIYMGDWVPEPKPDRCPLDEQVDRLRNALVQLPEKEQQILHLYYVNGISRVEIAYCLGVSRHWVNQRFVRGRDRLRDLLSDVG